MPGQCLLCPACVFMLMTWCQKVFSKQASVLILKGDSTFVVFHRERLHVTARSICSAFLAVKGNHVRVLLALCLQQHC